MLYSSVPDLIQAVKEHSQKTNSKIRSNIDPVNRYVGFSSNDGVDFHVKLTTFKEKNRDDWPSGVKDLIFSEEGRSIMIVCITHDHGFDSEAIKSCKLCMVSNIMTT